MTTTGLGPGEPAGNLTLGCPGRQVKRGFQRVRSLRKNHQSARVYEGVVAAVARVVQATLFDVHPRGTGKSRLLEKVSQERL